MAVQKSLHHQHPATLDPAAISPVRTVKIRSMKAIKISWLFCSVVTAVLGLAFLLFDPLVKHIILTRLVLKNSSQIVALWENPPITPHLKVYFFNLTNAEAFFNGTQKPQLREVGPYTYHQKWIKENVTWHGNGTMSYQTRKEFTFMPELSVGSQSRDRIITANVPALSAFYQMRNANYFYQLALNGFGYKGWVQKSPEELIWGYHEPLFALAQLTMDNAPEMDSFGFFSRKNYSTGVPVYTMYTGESDPYNLSRISSVDGKSSLGKWSEERCNLVQGSDGATFNPYIQQKDTLWFFNEELCRSLPMVFDTKVTAAGNLPGYRFRPRQDVFMSEASYPENRCFCEGQEKELCDMCGDGMMPISSCQFDAPIILSWPHFLHANTSYLNSVHGLNPDVDKHGFYFDVQPTTGTTLSAKARIQVNLAVKRNSAFTAISQVPTTILPLLWFEEGLDQLGPELNEAISEAVTWPPMLKNYLLCVLVGIGIATLFISLLVLIQFLQNRHQRRRFPRTMDSHFLAYLDGSFLTALKCGGEHLVQMNLSGYGVQEAQCDRLLPSTSTSSSADSSKASSVSHSRNSSTGSTPPHFVNDERDLLNPAAESSA